MGRITKKQQGNNLKLSAFAKAWIQSNMKPFTSDDIKLAFFKRNPGLKAVTLPNVFKDLQQSGIIKPSGKYIKSRFKVAKGRPIKEYISQVYSNKQRAKRESTVSRIKRESLEEMDLFKDLN